MLQDGFLLERMLRTPISTILDCSFTGLRDIAALFAMCRGNPQNVNADRFKEINQLRPFCATSLYAHEKQD